MNLHNTSKEELDRLIKEMGTVLPSEEIPEYQIMYGEPLKSTIKKSLIAVGSAMQSNGYTPIETYNVLMSVLADVWFDFYASQDMEQIGAAISRDMSQKLLDYHAFGKEAHNEEKR